MVRDLTRVLLGYSFGETPLETVPKRFRIIANSTVKQWWFLNKRKEGKGFFHSCWLSNFAPLSIFGQHRMLHTHCCFPPFYSLFRKKKKRWQQTESLKKWKEEGGFKFETKLIDQTDTYIRGAESCRNTKLKTGKGKGEKLLYFGWLCAYDVLQRRNKCFTA